MAKSQIPYRLCRFFGAVKYVFLQFTSVQQSAQVTAQAAALGDTWILPLPGPNGSLHPSSLASASPWRHAEPPGGSRGQEDTKSKNLDLGSGGPCMLRLRWTHGRCALKSGLIVAPNIGKVWDSLINQWMDWGSYIQNQICR